MNDRVKTKKRLGISSTCSQRAKSEVDFQIYHQIIYENNTKKEQEINIPGCCSLLQLLKANQHMSLHLCSVQHEAGSCFEHFLYSHQLQLPE
jgi:hypothetical protein